MYQDTIAAISTAVGQAGIGVVRLSGKEARPIAAKLFTGELGHRRLAYGHIIDPDTGATVDEVLVAYMAAPHTYTREDVVEINCHGGPLPLQRVLELALRHGARLANPGEFTLRAFLNGRIDLAQAEAVLDVVQARTEAGLRLAVQGLGGRLSAPLKELRRQLVTLLAYLSASVDFAEDEIEEQEVLRPLSGIRQRLQELLAGAEAGMVYRHGVRTAIVGRPNVGKSSLLNRLLRENRAIVTPVPGTTRDTLEETLNLRGVPFLLVDTAGIVHSLDPVESLGVERSRRAIEQADLVLLVVDSSQALDDADRGIMALVGNCAALLVANKCDLPLKAELKDIPWPVVPISALTGQGLAELEEKMVQMALGGHVHSGEWPLVTNARHKEALERAERHLAAAQKALEAGLPDDLMSIDVSAAASALGEVTGETLTEDLLNAIFSQFCVGK
ncbi:MAG: tRNA uridine-5-carboxymethylaminomethyl(34) synthesis GTPase MnmE [Chloroflexi bacterium]|nr:tRNA uridine-5-carboxymethylaminomethyl(34) synthesis GTPase MnmE [Chloroflexota bacterium]